MASLFIVLNIYCYHLRTWMRTQVTGRRVTSPVIVRRHLGFFEKLTNFFCHYLVTDVLEQLPIKLFALSTLSKQCRCH